MSLVVQPSKSSQSSDCTTIYIADSTGVYNATTNTGGYGTPNPASADINQITLRVGRPSVTTTVDFVLTGATTPTAIQFATGTTYPITSITVGQSTTSEALTDGVYPVTEFVDYLNTDAGTDVNVTNGSTAVTLTGTLTDYFNTAAGYVRLPDGLIYEVASYTSTSVLVLVEPYAGSTTADADWSNVWAGSVDMMTYCSSESCATEILGELFVTEVTESCSNTKSAARAFAMNAFFDLFILQADVSLSDDENFALNVAAYQETYCSGNTNSNCGCGCN